MAGGSVTREYRTLASGINSRVCGRRSGTDRPRHEKGSSTGVKRVGAGAAAAELTEQILIADDGAEMPCCFLVLTVDNAGLQTENGKQ